MQSEIALPELLPAQSNAAPDVCIRFGATPEELPEAVERGVRYDSAPNRLLLKVDGVGRYLICDGNLVTIERAPGAEDDDIRVFLLGSALGALLHQRDDLVLHGSAIEWDGKAVVFMGISGIGKSTTATAFRQKGHAILTDDLSVIRPNPDGQLLVWPGFPQCKLWLDSLQKLHFSPHTLKRIRGKIEKRAVPLDQDFKPVALPIHKIYLLRSHNNVATTLTPVTGHQKFIALKKHTYRFGYLAGIAGRTGHFQKAVELARQVNLVRVFRPREGFKLEELVAAIEADLSV